MTIQMNTINFGGREMETSTQIEDLKRLFTSIKRADGFQVWFDVDQQHFQIFGMDYETEEEALWMQHMLAKALASFLKNAGSLEIEHEQERIVAALRDVEWLLNPTNYYDTELTQKCRSVVGYTLMLRMVQHALLWAINPVTDAPNLFASHLDEARKFRQRVEAKQK